MLERVQFDSPGRELAPGLSLSRIRDFEAVRVSGYTSTRPPPSTGMGGYLHNLAGCSHNRDYVNKNVHILYPCRPKVQHVEMAQYVVFSRCQKSGI